MQPTAGLLRLALCLSTFSPLVSAWPGWLPPRDSLMVRQDAEETETLTEEVVTSTKAATETESKKAGDDDDEDSSSVTKTNSKDATATKTSEPKRTTYAANAAQGGVSMIDPNTMVVPTPLYKIGDNVSMSWNYTSVRGKPTAVDVILSCSYAAATYTLASNMSYETAVEFYWDTRDQQNDPEQPLAAQLYTLIVKDVDAEITGMPEPGYLGASNAVTFGLYDPQDYHPYNEWKKLYPFESSANGIERGATGLALTMSVITFVSFTWFVTGFGF